MFEVQKKINGKIVTKKLRHSIDAAEYQKAGWTVVKKPIIKDREGKDYEQNVPTAKETARDVDKEDVHGEKPDNGDGADVTPAPTPTEGGVAALDTSVAPTKKQMLEALKASGVNMHHASGDDKVKEAYDKMLADNAES